MAKMGFIGKDCVWKSNDEYFNAILGYKLSGDSSEKEWAALESIKDNASNTVYVSESTFKLNENLPGAEGIVFVGDDLYILYE